ncbi:hypothetical protein [Verrucomicrobium sp. BvORR106]|uniref:hypothetical protein n=1 Tax=Verrucomicrobium sp. BvORR106 TaxID=1403819 RepID=UPI002240EAB9|nr:hypothetical protein [Verrucomicrobium sp. BvORR106]
MAPKLAVLPLEALQPNTAWAFGLVGVVSTFGAGIWLLKSPRQGHEEVSFRELRDACSQNDALAVFAAHTRWLATLEIEPDASSELDLFEPFSEWEEMQLAAEDASSHWTADQFLSVLELQRASYLGERRA